jgi:acyl phosphate:glycerol-3-phosphate acyltransferase
MGSTRRSSPTDDALLITLRVLPFFTPGNCVCDTRRPPQHILPFALPGLACISPRVEAVSYIITGLVAYLLGSIPTGYLAAKTRGIDIRKVGSGNIGATNVFRTLGKPAGILVLLVDALKGFVSCCWVGALVYRLLNGHAPEGATLEYLKITGAFLAIMGHNYTCWLKFKGGKGIATSAGAVLALLPLALAVALGVFLILFFVTRYVSVASIGAAFVLPFGAWLAPKLLNREVSPRLIVVAAVIGALAIYKHRSNIQRLMNGTENRFGKKREAAQ